VCCLRRHLGLIAVVSAGALSFIRLSSSSNAGPETVLFLPCSIFTSRSPATSAAVACCDAQPDGNGHRPRPVIACDIAAPRAVRMSVRPSVRPSFRTKLHYFDSLWLCWRTCTMRNKLYSILTGGFGSVDKLYNWLCIRCRLWICRAAQQIGASGVCASSRDCGPGVVRCPGGQRCLAVGRSELHDCRSACSLEYVPCGVSHQRPTDACVPGRPTTIIAIKLHALRRSRSAGLSTRAGYSEEFFKYAETQRSTVLLWGRRHRRR